MRGATLASLLLLSLALPGCGKTADQPAAKRDAKPPALPDAGMGAAAMCKAATDHVVELMLASGATAAEQLKQPHDAEQDAMVVKTRGALFHACNEQKPAREQLDCVIASKAIEELWRCDDRTGAAPASKPAPATMPSLDGFGELQSDAVVALLGEPATRSPIVEYAADGSRLTEWAWPDKGVTISFAVVGAEPGRFWVPDDGPFWVPAKGPHALSSIACADTCTLKTTAGIGIGSTPAEVKKAYGKKLDKADSTAEKLIVGDLYGGLFFEVKDGKVAHIYIGGGAE